MTIYKWLKPDRTTPTQGVKWPVEVGEWTPSETPVICESGWHGMEAKDVLEHFSEGLILWEVEVRGERVDGDDKFATESMRLVREIGGIDDKSLRLFACDVAQSVLHIFEEKYPDDLRPRQAIEVSRRFANGDATQEELYAARSAAWSAAGDVAQAAAGYAAWAARDAAGSAAWYARYAARYAAWAARYAAEYAYSQQLIDLIERINTKEQA